LLLLSSVQGYEPIERFSERYIGGSLGLRVPRDNSETVTRHAGQVSEPEETVRLGVRAGRAQRYHRLPGALPKSRSGPMHRRMNFPL